MQRKHTHASEAHTSSVRAKAMSVSSVSSSSSTTTEHILLSVMEAKAVESGLAAEQHTAMMSCPDARRCAVAAVETLAASMERADIRAAAVSYAAHLAGKSRSVIYVCQA